MLDLTRITTEEELEKNLEKFHITVSYEDKPLLTFLTRVSKYKLPTAFVWLFWGSQEKSIFSSQQFDNNFEGSYYTVILLLLQCYALERLLETCSPEVQAEFFKKISYDNPHNIVKKSSVQNTHLRLVELCDELVTNKVIHQSSIKPAQNSAVTVSHTGKAAIDEANPLSLQTIPAQTILARTVYSVENTLDFIGNILDVLKDHTLTSDTIKKFEAYCSSISKTLWFGSWGSRDAVVLKYLLQEIISLYRGTNPYNINIGEQIRDYIKRSALAFNQITFQEISKFLQYSINTRNGTVDCFPRDDTTLPEDFYDQWSLWFKRYSAEAFYITEEDKITLLIEGDSIEVPYLAFYRQSLAILASMSAKTEHVSLDEAFSFLQSTFKNSRIQIRAMDKVAFKAYWQTVVSEYLRDLKKLETYIHSQVTDLKKQSVDTFQKQFLAWMTITTEYFNRNTESVIKETIYSFKEMCDMLDIPMREWDKLSKEQIKSFFNKKALKVHPDKVDSSEKQAAHEAFVLLQLYTNILTAYKISNYTLQDLIEPTALRHNNSDQKHSALRVKSIFNTSESSDSAEKDTRSHRM